MRYRIKHVGMVGYFAQVKRNFFSGWRTIGSHLNNQVGEYQENHLDHPLSQQREAISLAHQHANFNKVKKGFTTYRDIVL